eukprot:gene5092-5333_t
MSEPLGEASVPNRFSTQADDAPRQLRRLHNFSIHQQGKPQALVPLEAVQRSKKKPVACGSLLLPNSNGPATSESDSVVVVTGPILDWCLEYGPQPAVWLITEMAWYRLVKPSVSYSSTFQSLQVKQELAVRCRAALAQEPTAAVEQVQQRVLTAGLDNSKNDIASRNFGLPELQAEAAFLAAQMATLHAVRFASGLVADHSKL